MSLENMKAVLRNLCQNVTNSYLEKLQHMGTYFGHLGLDYGPAQMGSVLLIDLHHYQNQNWFLRN